MEQDKTKKASIEAAIKQINSAYGLGAVWSALDEIPKIAVVSTGALTLDKALGVGGLPRGRITELFGPEQTAKAQPLDSLVLTPIGWKEMGAIIPGDLVCTPDGSVAPVLGIFPQGEMEVVKVTFSDGSSAECTWDHLWTVQTWDDKQSGLYRTLSTKELYEDFKTPTRLKYMIPLTGFVRFEATEVTINPYMMGLLLGDGSFRDSTIKFTTADDEIVESFRLYAKETNQEIVKTKNTKYDWKIKKAVKGNGKSKARLDLESYDLADLYSHEKFIPDAYLYGDTNQRLSLLQGLMDTDGTIQTSGFMSFCSTSKKLAEEVVHLVRSLGGRGVISHNQTHYTHSDQYLSGKPSFRVSILFSNGLIPFRLPRKVARIKPDKIDYATRWVSDIQVVSSRECQCIFIDHPDGLYITNDFIVTHNTTLALTVIANIQKEGGTGAIIDVEHAIDIAYAKAIGVDVTKLLVSQPDSAEQALEIAEALVRGGVDCVVLDSVAMLVTEAEIKGDMTDMQYAPTARLMGKALRKLMAPIDKASCVFILINQLRDKIGGYGNPEVTPGGRSIKYMSSVRIDLRRKEQIKDDDQVYGIRVLAKVIKNKVAPPSKQAEFSVYYGKGIDRIESVVDAAFDEGIITRSGAWYKLDGEQLGQGKPNAIARLKDDQVLLKRIEDALWVKAQKS